MKLKPYLNGYSSAIAFVVIGMTLNLTGQFNPVGAIVSHPAHLQNLPACYIQTPKGQIIDLSQKCGFIKPAICSTSLGSASRDAVLVDFCQKNQRCALTNNCNSIPRGINTPPPGTPMG